MDEHELMDALQRHADALLLGWATASASGVGEDHVKLARSICRQLDPLLSTLREVLSDGRAAKWAHYAFRSFDLIDVRALALSLTLAHCRLDSSSRALALSRARRPTSSLDALRPLRSSCCCA
jgi:hypothetical protein